ncbi:hypothetical protein BGZ65_012647 [Modicella reniformis]|uniref:Uncharacterized protein n=1 Tax=Modicella reniformis TaxID=1440133 RepID=A0A9P6LUN7_9FUNG|nr:hypothetical protein BGZ65_012647 [Modicella reniformis]
MNNASGKRSIYERITYHPGVVLDVDIIDTTEQTISTREEDVRHPQIRLQEKSRMKNTIDQTLVVYTKISIAHAYTPELQTIMSGQTIIIQSMEQHFDRLQIEMDKNKELQQQLVQMQKTIDEKQDQTNRMHQQALDRLAIIQDKEQAVLTQTYELHEYPITRLFQRP